MPIYEYRCGTCGEVFEVIRSITNEAPAPCKSCGGEETERLISQSSFVLKGTGWYKTDYGSSGSAGTESKSPAANQGSSSETSETKADSSSNTSKASESSSPTPAKAATAD